MPFASRNFWIIYALLTTGFIVGVVFYHLSSYLTLIVDNPWGYLRDYFVWIGSLSVMPRVAIAVIDTLWSLQTVLVIEQARGDTR